MLPVRAIIFDLDGTLVDSLPGIEYSARAALASVCPGLQLPSLRRFIGPPVREVFRHSLKIDAPETLDALNIAFRRSYDDDGWRRSELFANTENTLNSLSDRNCPLYVLTNKPAPASNRILEHLKIQHYFQRVIAPDPDLRPLPKPAAALRFQEEAMLNPGQTLLLGDSLDDAAAANACGYLFGAIRFGYGNAATQTEYPRDFTLSTYTDLFTHIQLLLQS